MDLNFDLIASSFPLLLAGAAITVEITALSVGFGLLIGCMVGIARLCNVKALRYLANIYVDFIRGTPLLVQIFLVYFALPGITGSRVDPFFAAISACSINSGAYIAEIFRAGIQSIDPGQMEAGRSLGMTWAQTMRYIIMPQAFKRIIPPLGNGTTGRFFQEVHATKQSTLTTTGRSDDYQHFLFCNGKVYATQNMQVAEAFM